MNPSMKIPAGTTRKRVRGRWAHTLAGACVLVAAVTGCGGTSAKSSSKDGAPGTSVIGDVVDQTSAGQSGNTAVTDAAACMLSESDVSAAMKQPMTMADSAGSNICIYTAPADPNVLIEVETFATRAEAVVYSSPEANSEHINGLGDDAFWNLTQDMVYARKGERSLIVKSATSANLAADPHAWKASMVALATLVLAKF